MVKYSSFLYIFILERTVYILKCETKKEKITKKVSHFFSKNIDDVDIAIELLLYIIKKQIFLDGNKRTAVIFSNHYLISKGKGIIVIPVELTDEFKDLLILYYEGKDENKIKKFIKEKCYIMI